MIIPTHAMSKKLKIEDIRIGMTLCDKKNKISNASSRHIR